VAHVAQEPPVKEPAHPVRYLPLPQFPQLEQPPPLVWGHAVPQEERHWVEGHEPQLLHLPALRPEHEERYLPVPHVAHRVQEPCWCADVVGECAVLGVLCWVSCAVCCCVGELFLIFVR
jgi:hypothetical protein